MFNLKCYNLGFCIYIKDFKVLMVILILKFFCVSFGIFCFGVFGVFVFVVCLYLLEFFFLY